MPRLFPIKWEFLKQNYQTCIILVAEKKLNLVFYQSKGHAVHWKQCLVWLWSVFSTAKNKLVHKIVLFLHFFMALTKSDAKSAGFESMPLFNVSSRKDRFVSSVSWASSKEDITASKSILNVWQVPTLLWCNWSLHCLLGLLFPWFYQPLQLGTGELLPLLELMPVPFHLNNCLMLSYKTPQHPLTWGTWLSVNWRLLPVFWYLGKNQTVKIIS